MAMATSKKQELKKILLIMFIILPPDGIYGLDIYRKEHSNGRLPCEHNIPDNEIHRVKWFRSSRDDIFEKDGPAVVSWDGITQPYTTDNYGIDKNYSLIIYNMSQSDTGMYSCYVSRNTGGDVYKYIVSMAVYQSEGNAVDLIAEYETLVSLPCRSNLTTVMEGEKVLWYKGSKAKNFQGDDQAIASWKHGEKHSVDNYSLNDDFSLGIANVSSKNEGMYRCIVETDERKASARDTQLTVYALPQDVPRLHLSETLDSTVVNCSVNNVYPLLYPEFGFHHDKEYSVQNDDGTYSTSISGIAPDNLVNITIECFFPHFNYTKSSSYYIPKNISKCTLDPAGEHECTETSRLGLIIGIVVVTLLFVIAVIMIKIIMTKNKGGRIECSAYYAEVGMK